MFPRDRKQLANRHSASNYFIKPDGSGLWVLWLDYPHTLTLAGGVGAGSGWSSDIGELKPGMLINLPPVLVTLCW